MSSPVNRQQRRRAASLGTSDSLTMGGPLTGTRALLDRAAQARDRGDLTGALQLCQQAVRVEPANPEIHFTAATVLEAGRDLPNAIATYRHVLKLKPGFLPALVNSAACLADLGWLPECLDYYQAALKADPQSLVVRQNMAQVLMQMKRPGEALPHLKALAAARKTAADDSALAEALDMLGDKDGAIAAYRDAIKHGVPTAPARILMARLELVRGDLAAARGHVEAALAADPHNGHVHLVLANNFAEDPSLDERIATAEAALAQASDTAVEQTTAPLHFALARFKDRAGRYDEAWAHLESGNGLLADRHIGEDKRLADQARSAMDRYTDQSVAGSRDHGSDSEQPVFVFGLPRSGTTLLEQMLASHAEIAGLGERDMTAWISNYLRTPSPERLRKAAHAYLSSYPAAAADKTRVIDKSLGSYLEIGMLLDLFPNAKLINCLRHPLDVAFSAWSQHFATSALVYTYRFDRLASHMELYADLMRHWHRVFPGRILDVRYEDLVAAPEATARQAVAHLGLEWDPACLDFHTTAREVRTASVTQVRRPLYREALGRWRNYDHHLGGLKSELSDLIDAYDAGGDYGWGAASR